MWRFTQTPKWNPQIFRHKFGSHYGDMFDRNYLLSRNPFEDHQLIDERDTPLANLIEKQNRFVLEIPVPGFKKEDIEIHVERDELVVKGKKEQDDLNDSDYIILEHNYEQFERSFYLGSITDQEKIEATVKNGILYITLHHKKGSDTRSTVKDIKVS